MISCGIFRSSSYSRLIGSEAAEEPAQTVASDRKTPYLSGKASPHRMHSFEEIAAGLKPVSIIWRSCDLRRRISDN